VDIPQKSTPQVQSEQFYDTTHQRKLTSIKRSAAVSQKPQEALHII